MSDEASTIERIVPDAVSPGDATGQATLELHLRRYKFAATQLRPGRLLDIACGVGYGTRLMAVEGSGVTEAVGVDLSNRAIDHASRHYSAPGVRFCRHDAMTFQDEMGFNSIVSLETFEHIRDPDGLLAQLTSLLLPEGVIIASVPTTPSVDVNPYHLRDFTERTFRAMFSRRGLKEVASFRQVQAYPLFKTLRREEARMADLRPNVTSYYLSHPVALSKRLLATLRYGFSNRYLTVVFEKGT